MVKIILVILVYCLAFVFVYKFFDYAIKCDEQQTEIKRLEMWLSTYKFISESYKKMYENAVNYKLKEDKKNNKPKK